MQILLRLATSQALLPFITTVNNRSQHRTIHSSVVISHYLSLVHIPFITYKPKRRNARKLF